jgi:hypothetical protein
VIDSQSSYVTLGVARSKLALLARSPVLPAAAGPLREQLLLKLLLLLPC